MADTLIQPPGATPPVVAAASTDQAVKVYGSGDTEVRALDGVTVDFEARRFTAIMGPSGSGKSTLLHCIAGLDTLTSGKAFIGDTDLSTLDDTGLTLLRRDRVGFVFQAFNLVPTLTADGEHHAAHGASPVARATRRGSTRSCRHPGPDPTACATDRARCPAASSSGWRWPAPWPAGRRSSSPTSRPATSTREPAARSSRFMRQAVDDLDQTDRDGHPRSRVAAS